MATERFLATAGLLLVVTLGCTAGRGAPGTGARVPLDSAYLLDPLTGYEGSVAAAEAALLRQAHRDLVMTGWAEEALAAAESVLAASPGSPPGSVLKAQALLASGDALQALTIAAPIAAADPSYEAAQLVTGRAAERADRVVEAFVAYAAAAARSALAAERFAALRPRAIEILSLRIGEALARGRVDDAGADLAILQRWAPDEEASLRSSADVAVAVGDRAAELQAVRAWTRLGTADDDLLLRQARLELDIGDASVALRLLQDLAASRPADAAIASELARARFSWRLGLLPPKVARLGRKPELSRADMAVLLYWLFPSVRYGQAETGTIANDVFDHPHRQEIVRVANLGIMAVDPRLHRFNPNQLLDRRSALLGVLRALDRHDPRPACLRGRGQISVAGGAVCDLAVTCGLLASGAECNPGVTAGGGDVLDWTRRALDRLGAQ